MKENKKEKYKKIGLRLLAFGVFVYSILLFFINKDEGWFDFFTEDYSEEPTISLVQGKTAVQSLFNEMTYYAVLESGDVEGFPFQSAPGDMKTLSKKAFETLKIGDEIAGFQRDDGFILSEDKWEEYLDFFIFLVIAFGYPIGYVTFWLLKIKKIKSLIEGLLSYTFLTFLGVGFVGLLIFMAFQFGGAIKGTIERIGVDTIESDAEITGRKYDDNLRRYEENNHYFGLTYRDQDNHLIHITKEVTANTFFKYEHTSTMPIAYEAKNPYRAYIKSMDFRDVLSVILSLRTFMLLLTVVMAVLLTYTFFVLYKRKKKSKHSKQ